MYAPAVWRCRFVNERFYRIDRARKCLQLLGGCDVDAETTDPHPPKGDLQHALNSNNTVLRCVNFKV
jgi:hypothetical protein